LSLMYLAKRFVFPEYRRKITTVELDALSKMPSGVALTSRHIANVLKKPWPLATFVTRWIYLRHFQRRRIPYVALYSSSGTYPLEYNAEQTPFRDSQVVLLPKQDRFGVPKLRIDWRVASDDIDSIASTYRIVQGALKASGVAAITFDPNT